MELTDTDYENQTPLIEALIKARSEFEPITKDGKANYGKYATLDNIIKCTDNGLGNNGLNIKHNTEYREGKQYLISMLRHVSNCKPDITETCISDYDSGNKSNTLQAYGGTLTYLKRYHMGLLLNIATDEDIDGNDKGKAEQSKQDKTTTQGKSITKPPATQGKDEPPQDETPDPALAYIARINEMQTIFELRKWVDKHTPDLKKLSEEDKKPIRKLLVSREKELQDKQDKINASKTGEGEIPQDDPDLAGLGEKEHKDPPA